MNNKSFAVLPCNGLDKCAGCITKEIALQIAEYSDSEILCPVFYRVSDKKYNEIAAERNLLVIDGCAVRCASKIAAEKNLKIHEKINVSDLVKQRGITLPDGLKLGEKEKEFAKKIAENILSAEEKQEQTEGGKVSFPNALDYEIYKKDKFIFRVPRNDGFYFNENDVWVYIDGNKARIGISDFVQKSLSDIMFFTPPAIGSEIEQFEEMGEIESGKAVFEIVSPVSGRITAVNEMLEDCPEILNDNPYEKGWIAEVELLDFESDKELLHKFEGYFPVLKRKVDRFHV